MRHIASLLVFALTLAAGPAHAGPRVAVVQSDDLEPYTAPVQSFLDALGEPAIVVNLNGRKADAVVVVEKLRRERPEVVFALGAKAAFTVREGLPGTPVVYTAIMNPERYGVTGDQTVGIAATVPAELYLSQFIGFFPDIKTIGLLRGPLTTDANMAEISDAAAAVGVTLVVDQVESARKVRPTFNRMAPKVDAVWLKPDREMLSTEAFRVLTEETRRRRMPLLVETPNMVAAGALFATVPDPKGVGEQAAQIALQILDGVSPAEIGNQAPNKVLVTLNMRTVELGEIDFDELLLDFVDVPL